MSTQEIKKEREKEREFNLHAGNLGGGPVDQELDHSIFSDIVETTLSEGSKDLLRNLVSKDLVLANLDDAEVNEWRWKIRSTRELFFEMHPAKDCLVTGEDRAAINDSPYDTLEPLSDEQRMVAYNFFDMLETRPTRAKNMGQQTVLNTQFRESRVDKGTESSNGGIVGRLRK